MSQSFTRGVPIDPDPSLANNSNLLVPSQYAVKTYVDNGLSTKQNILGYVPVAPTRAINTTSPLSGGGDLTIDRTLSISNAAADGTTKGAATFQASDFDDNGSGLIKLDYTNGQKATASQPGYLTSTDWSTFNSKQSAGNYITALTGDVTASGPGSVAATIANGSVTYAKMQVASTTSKLIGSSASSTTLQEITLGTGLSMSGSTLNASAAGPTVNQVMAYIAAY